MPLWQEYLVGVKTCSNFINLSIKFVIQLQQFSIKFTKLQLSIGFSNLSKLMIKWMSTFITKSVLDTTLTLSAFISSGVKSFPKLFSLELPSWTLLFLDNSHKKCCQLGIRWSKFQLFHLLKTSFTETTICVTPRARLIVVIFVKEILLRTKHASHIVSTNFGTDSFSYLQVLGIIKPKVSLIYAY